MTKYTHMTETSPLLPRKAQNNIKVQVPKIRAHVNLQTTLQTLSGICLVVSFAGCTYAFGVFSSLLQAKLALKQKSLDLMASVGNLGLYLSLFVGFAVERFGFRRVILFGGLLVFGGFSYIWLAITGKLYVNEHLVTLAYFIAQVGACCHIATAVSATVKALPPSSRGTAVGLVKSYFGVSSAVLANLSSGVFSEYPLSFVCFVAILIPFAGMRFIMRVTC